MMAFISPSVLYRRVVFILTLLIVLACTLLAILRTHVHEETATRRRNAFDKVRTLDFGAGGYIPTAFRPSTYLGTTATKEPTTRDEWETFVDMVESEEDSPVVRSRWSGLKQRINDFVYRLYFGSLSLHQNDPARYRTDWQDLPPNIKALKEYEYARGLLYQGSGARINRFLERARSGKGVVVSVVGGSVSKGRGLPIRQSHDSAKNGSIPHSHSTRFQRDKRNLAKNWRIDPRPSVSQNLYNPLNLHYQIFQFINRTFPATPRSSDGVSDKAYRGENLFVNGAQGGVGSDYFAGCWKEHIPEDSDLVLVDLGINDIRDLASMENYELLLRSLLDMESQPAVINLQPFSLLFKTLSSASSLHIDVAAFYDTPVISIRDIVLPRILNDATRRISPGSGANGGLEIAKWFRNVPSEELVEGDPKNVYVEEADRWVDLMHISRHGHSLLAEMAIHYLQTQIQLMSPFDVYNHNGLSLIAVDDSPNLSSEGSQAQSISRTDDLSEEESLTDIPSMLLASHYSTRKPIRISNPSCRSTNSAFRLDRLKLDADGVEANKHWGQYNWGEKRYLVASNPGSRISVRFNVSVPAFRSLRHRNGELKSEKIHYEERGQGYVKIGHLRSNALGLGSLNCWVERETAGGSSEKEEKARRGTEDLPTRVDGWWEIRERNQVVLTTIADDLLPGPHTLHCTLLDETLDPDGGTEFRLTAVVYE